jgi:hypothetical protein
MEIEVELVLLCSKRIGLNSYPLLCHLVSSCDSDEAVVVMLRFVIIWPLNKEYLSSYL